MKTKKQVLEENPNLKTLINSVISKTGQSSVEDVNSNGAAAGFNGFIYYSDTVKFARRYNVTIVSMLENQASDFGLETVEMVAGFGVFRHNKMDKDDRKDLYRFLIGAKCKETTIPNLMAWYALEEVCRLFED